MDATFLELVDRFLNPTPARKLFILSGLIFLTIASWATVYIMGGSRLAYVHLMYLPIMLSGLFFLIPGGIIAGTIVGIIAGPFLPYDTDLSQSQPLISWLTRLVFFVGIGTLSGCTSKIFRRYIKELKDKYRIDPVTQVFSLSGLNHLMCQWTEEKRHFSAAIIEIRNFDEIERAMGPSNVEVLLKQVTNRLKQATGEEEILGHVSHSTFAVFIPQAACIRSIIDEYRKVISRPYEVAGVPIFVEFLFGISKYPEHDTNIAGLIRKGKVAISSSVNESQIYYEYDENCEDKYLERINILHELHTALENKDLSLNYQPKLDFATGKVTGAEALVRWIHPIKGPISPCLFIPIAEQTLLINSYTKWMLLKSLNDLKLWVEQSYDLSLSVNLSMKNFYDPTIFELLYYLTEKYKLDPKRIEIELTESCVNNEMSLVIKRIEEMISKGYKVSIDDFGTGQASLSYILSLPLTGLKIDRIFIKDMVNNDAAYAVVRSAIMLGHQLGLEVTAEGIEQEIEYQKLRELGCNIAQGFYCARPMSNDHFMHWLEN